MKLSKFIFSVREGDDITMLNTINGSIIRLSSDEYDSMIHPGDYTNDLVGLGFLVGDGSDEDADFLESLRTDLLKEDHCCIHILPTTGCNFRCGYCYQSGIDRSHSFSKDDVHSITESVARWLEPKSVRTLNLVLHGGEPTLNWPFVEELLLVFTAMTGSMGIECKIQIVTNGYLLDRGKIDLLTRYDCTRIQLTLDGMRDIHDSRRPLVNGGPTFDRIIRNIHSILESDYGGRISIRINYDKENLAEVPELLEFLATEFDIGRMDLSFGLVTPTLIHIDREYQEGDDVVQMYLFLRSEAEKQGFRFDNIYVHDGFCSAKSRNTIVISPDGHYYKCLSTVGRTDLSCGEIQDPIPNTSMTSPDLYRECLGTGCPWVPICHCGCRFESMVSNGEGGRIHCNRRIVEGINWSLLRPS